MAAPVPLSADRVRLGLVELLSGAVDPSAGGGVAAQLGSLYGAQIAGVGSVWSKTGASATAWEKLVQSFEWFNVRDLGAVGDGTTDDRAAIQATIDQCVAAGGGVVYFPRGNYAVSQNASNGYSLLLRNAVGVQLVGQGWASQITQTGNAGSADWSLVQIDGVSSQIRLDSLNLSGAGLTNPTTGCHLINAGAVSGAMADLQFFRCRLTGMVAGAGDGILLAGSGGDPISRCWVSDCTLNGIARYGVHVQQGVSFVQVTGNEMTDCTREIVVDTTSNVTINALSILNNQINHTGTDKLAIQLNGPAALLTRLVMAHNVILGGFVEGSAIQFASMLGNVQTSGVFASGNSSWRLFGSVTDVVVSGNAMDRASGSSAGFCVSLEASGGNSPTRCRIGNNVLVNEVTAAGFVQAIDASTCSIGQNIGRSSNAGVSTAYGIDIQAVTTAVDNMLVQGNQITAAAGSFAAGVRLLVNGSNVVNVGVMSNTGTQIDYGIEFDDAGAGAFTGQIMWAANNFDSAVGDYHNTGAAAVIPVIGLNAGTFGPQLFSGAGSPEGVVTARVGSIFLRSDGGPGTVVYYKESGTGSTGWIGIGGAPIVFGTGDTGTSGAAGYLAPGWIAALSATELQMTLTRPGTLRSLYIAVAVAGTGAATNTYTVRKNGVDTTITTTIANTSAGAASDVTHSVTVVAGDLLSVSCAKSGGVAAGQSDVTATVELA